MRMPRFNRYQTIIVTLYFILFVAFTLSSCASQPEFRPNSPEDHTKQFVGALFENPVK